MANVISSHKHGNMKYAELQIKLELNWIQIDFFNNTFVL